MVSSVVNEGGGGERKIVKGTSRASFIPRFITCHSIACSPDSDLSVAFCFVKYIVSNFLKGSFRDDQHYCAQGHTGHSRNTPQP